MELKPNCGSDKAWVYTVAADYADNEVKAETLAVKFGNPESKLHEVLFLLRLLKLS